MEIPQWDGKTKGGSTHSSGVYFWTITYNVSVGSTKIEKKENGYVHLVEPQ